VGRGERDLDKLLAGLQPTLSDERYAFEATDHAALDADMFALVREEEGLTTIKVSTSGGWARISLGVYSSLDAVGLTAALSNALAAAGISANVVAALNHDHIFVPWDQRNDALSAIEGLA
jgi:hypothetical protein